LHKFISPTFTWARHIHGVNGVNRPDRLCVPPSFLLRASREDVGPTQLLTRSIHTGCGAHPASFLIRYLPHFPRGVKRPGVKLITDLRIRPVWRLTIHILLCLNGARGVISSLLTQTPQELRDSRPTSCMVLSSPHS